MTPSLLFVIAGVFGVVASGGYLLLSLLDRYNVQLDARLRQLPGTGSQAPGARRKHSSVGNTWMSQLLKWATPRVVPHGKEDRRRHQTRLLNAGIYSSSALSLYFAAKLVLMLLPLLLGLSAAWLGFVSPYVGWLSGSLTGLVAMALPSVWLSRQIRRRHIMLRRSLADFLDLMTVCLQSGLSLQGSIQRVSEELRIAHPIFAGEMNIVQRDIDLGVSIDSALRHFADRSGYEGLRTLSTFVHESQRLGTELVEALRLHADMLRAQREQAAEELAQTASVKILFPTLLLILPAVFVVMAGPAAIQIQEAFAKQNP